MRKFEAPTLEEAYAEAAREFSCSITELDIQVLQNPSRGFLGIGRKSAIIAVTSRAAEKISRIEENVETADTSEMKNVPEKKRAPRREKEERPGRPRPRREKKKRVPEIQPVKTDEPAIEKESEKSREETHEKSGVEKRRALEKTDAIFDNFYTETPDIDSVAVEIEREINTLFGHACFNIDEIRVSAYDEETILLEFKGEDAALLIGKEGYRYKALAYLLYNWIHGKYGFRVRLEIAEFLKSQETMIENYLQPIVERIEKEGRAQTKVLDGILVQIALKRLRELFPKKYVAIRTNREGGRYIIVNEFLERR
ncbi:Jag N-terminal domain-containing protein [Hydrogenimonas sp.]